MIAVKIPTSAYPIPIITRLSGIERRNDGPKKMNAIPQQKVLVIIVTLLLTFLGKYCTKKLDGI